MRSFLGRSRKLPILIFLAHCALSPAGAHAALLDDDPNAMGPSPMLEQTVINGQTVPDSDPVAKATVMLLSSAGGCSGTLIARDLVLTAAHCVAKLAQGSEQIKVIAPSLNSFYIPASHWAVHPGFKPIKTLGFLGMIPVAEPTTLHDIALIHMDLPMLGPMLIANLPSRNPVGETIELTVAGFGITNANDTSTFGTLHVAASNGKVVKITYINSTESEDQLELTGSKPFCHGDSGGPSFLANDNKLTVVGVHSHSHLGGEVSCATGTRDMSVFANLDWIKKAAKELRSVKGA